MGFHLPNLNLETAQEFRRQLLANTVLVKAAQLSAGAGLPIIEGILVNLATGASSTDRAVPIWNTLIAVAVLHVLLLIVVLVAEVPLAQFLLEFNAKENHLRQTKARADSFEKFTKTYRDSTVAAQSSLLIIEGIPHSEWRTLEKVFGEVLGPWLARKRNIFWFYDTADRDNFAVYLMRESGQLTKEFRQCHGEIQQTNREWGVGQGHVGICFAQKRTLFSADVTNAEVRDIMASENPQDAQNYRCFLSAPIFVDGNARGVLVVSSSKPEQFEKGVHQPVVELIATLLAKSMQRFAAGRGLSDGEG
jgi:GAF domain-containing protein